MFQIEIDIRGNHLVLEDLHSRVRKLRMIWENCWFSNYKIFKHVHQFLANNDIINSANSFGGMKSYFSKRIPCCSSVWNSQIACFTNFKQRMAMFIDVGVTIFLRRKCVGEAGFHNLGYVCRDRSQRKLVHSQFWQLGHQSTWIVIDET